MDIYYYCDNNHGWYSVDTQTMKALGIQPKSRHSAIDERAGVAYFEHNSDGDVLLDALRKAGVQFRVRTVYQGEESPVRELLAV